MISDGCISRRVPIGMWLTPSFPSTNPLTQHPSFHSHCSEMPYSQRKVDRNGLWMFWKQGWNDPLLLKGHSQIVDTYLMHASSLKYNFKVRVSS